MAGSEWFRLAVRDIHLIQDHMRVYVYFVNPSPVSGITTLVPNNAHSLSLRYLFAVQDAACRTTPLLFRVLLVIKQTPKWEIIVISEAKWEDAAHRVPHRTTNGSKCHLTLLFATHHLLISTQ